MIKVKNLEKAFEYIKLGQFRKVSKKLWEDKDFVMEAIKVNPHSLICASKVFRADPEIAFYAVEVSSSAIIYVSDELKNNKELVLKAVSKDGHVLAYVSNDMQNDEDVVWAAIQNNGFAIIEANERFINMKKYALAALKQNGFVMKYYKDEFKQDPKFIKASLIGITRVDPLNIQNVDLKYFGDKEFVNELKEVLDENARKIEKREFENPVVKMRLIGRILRAKNILSDKEKAYKLFKNMQKQHQKQEDLNQKIDYVYFQQNNQEEYENAQQKD